MPIQNQPAQRTCKTPHSSTVLEEKSFVSVSEIILKKAHREHHLTRLCSFLKQPHTTLLMLSEDQTEALQIANKWQESGSMKINK